MASLVAVPYGCQGYAGAFCLGIMDRKWTEGLSEEGAIALVDNCIKELLIRFLINQENFIVKKIDEGGLKVIKFGADLADT